MDTVTVTLTPDLGEPQTVTFEPGHFVWRGPDRGMAFEATRAGWPLTVWCWCDREWRISVGVSCGDAGLPPEGWRGTIEALGRPVRDVLEGIA
jgi:hypothetical protein